ncbi:hypothetical protein GCM10020295_78260 [Streptomyces cinereospinus]
MPDSASRSAGAPVTVSATLTGVDGHTVVFDVEAHDAAAVLSGQHSRALVNRARFTRRLAPRPDSTGRADAGTPAHAVVRSRPEHTSVQARRYSGTERRAGLLGAADQRGHR